MDKGTKMTPREVERIAVLIGAGKSVTEIARDLNRSRNTIYNYLRAIRDAAKGTFVHQAESCVRPELIEPYVKKSPKAEIMNQEMRAQEVRMANRPEIRLNREGKCILDPENALLIARELEAGTHVDIITRLMKVDLSTVNRVRCYLDLLQKKQNDEAVRYKASSQLPKEVCEAMEFRIGFFPKEKSPEELNADFRRKVLLNQQATRDLLNSIDSLLRKLLRELSCDAHDQ